MSRIANPILRGCWPDPSWCRVGEDVYLTNSTFTWVPGLPIRHSTDLVHWELVGHALVDPEPYLLGAVKDSEGIFAPTLRHIDGKFVLVCTAVLGQDGGQAGGAARSFIVTADRPEGPWSEPRFIEGAGGIDPDIFMDRDGQVWWTGTRLAAEPLWHDQTEIWTRPFDLETARFTGEETVIWHGAVEKVVWSEGPHLYEKDGWYYLLTAEGGTAEEHSVSVARSRSVTGPWEGTKRNPIFTHRNLGASYPVHYVGHADLLQMPDGSWWAVMLGIRWKDRHHLLGRETFLAPVEWEDGWPVFNPGVGRLSDVVEVPLASGEDVLAPTGALQWRPLSAEHFAAESVRVLGTDWGTLETAPFRGIRVDEWEWGLALRCDGVDPDGGLALVQDAANWVRVTRGADGPVVETRVAGVTERLALDLDGVDARFAWLRLDGLDLEVGVGAAPGEGACRRLDARWLSTQSAGGFTGCLGGTWGVADDCELLLLGRADATED